MCKDFNTKVCSSCNQEKPFNFFYKDRNRKDGLSSRCKPCQILKSKEWADSNKEKRREISRKYTANNLDKIKQSRAALRQTKEYKDKNREWRKKNIVAYLKKRRETDKHYAFKIRIQRIIRKAFERNGFTKISKTNDILGCSWDEFKAHIEKQFTKGMNWDNRKDWHIDHIIPISTAETENDVIKLNHFTNLRPLWAKDNIEKRDKILTLI